jgi:hypothetical protein
MMRNRKVTEVWSSECQGPGFKDAKIMVQQRGDLLNIQQRQIPNQNLELLALI